MRTWWAFLRARLPGGRRQYCRQCRQPLVVLRHNDDFCSEACDQKFSVEEAW